MEYNVRVIKYANNKQQIRLYGVPIHFKDKISKYNIDKKTINYNCIDTDGEYIDSDKKHSDINSRNRTINSIYSIARANDWDYFITLTFNEEIVNRKNYDDVMYNTSLYLKRMKKHNSDFKYLIVPELHKDGKSWHIHGLISGLDESYFSDSGYRDRDNIIYNIRSYGLGFTTATKIIDNDKVVNYICKYISKELCAITKNKHRFICSQNVHRPIEKKVYIPQQENLLKYISGHIKYAKTLEYLDSNIVYIETENLEHIFDII